MKAKKVSKKKTSKKKTSKKNPSLLDKILKKKPRIQEDTITIKVKDGLVIIKGDARDSYTELVDILSKSDLKLTFEPKNSKKKYVLNKEESTSSKTRSRSRRFDF